MKFTPVRAHVRRFLLFFCFCVTLSSLWALLPPPPPPLQIAAAGDLSVSAKLRGAPLDLTTRFALNTRVLARAPFSVKKWKVTECKIMGLSLQITDSAEMRSLDYIRNELNLDQYGLRSLDIVEGDILLDIATHVGMTATLMAKLFPQARVIGIEPMPANYVAAIRNFEQNGVADRVQVLFGALAADARPLQLHYDRLNTGGSTSDAAQPGLKMGKESFTLQTFTLEELLRVHNVDPARVKFIKLDCESCEYSLAAGLSPELRVMFKHAKVSFEIHPPPSWATEEMQAATFELLLGPGAPRPVLRHKSSSYNNGTLITGTQQNYRIF